MILSDIDLNEQAWHLATLLIAILQPVLFLALVIGLILTSAHFLTMLGTRWGDRRANSKALMFSLGIHGMLACGLIALIPEYRPNIAARLADSNDAPIRIETKLDRTDLADQHSEPGNSPIWDQVQPTDPLEWERFNAPPVDLEHIDQALDRPEEKHEFEPALANDSQPLPSEANPTPEQEVRVEQSELIEATIDITPEMLAVNSRQDDPAYSALRDRVDRPTEDIFGQDDPTLSRPTTGAVERLSPELSRDQESLTIETTPAPQAELSRASTADMIQRSAAPVIVLTNPELLGQSPAVAESTGNRSTSPEPTMTRTQPRTELFTDEPALVRSYEPSMTPATPDTFTPDTQSSTSGDNQLVPLPGERPQMVLPNENLIARVEQRNVPSAYVLRSDQLRERAILKYGGSEASENAVDLSLKWLASVQTPEGYWDASQYGSGQVGIDDEGIDRQFAGRFADTGVTALAVLAFMGKMNTVDEGQYSENVNRALRWLISQQKTRKWANGDQTSGYLGGEAEQFAGMYCHGMATFALAEAYAISKDRQKAEFLREPLENAIGYILATQINDGGWRYLKGQPDGDMSMFGWQLMAIKSAEAGGVVIPFEAKNRMIKFLRSRQLGRYGGLAGYRAGDPPSPAMTAESLFCHQVLGIDTDLSATEEATRYLLANRPSRSTMNLYYWYYGTLSMYQRGGNDWELWNRALRDLLVSEQRTIGPQAGSWDPRGEWGRYGGRIYSTAIATLSLEVYYRYLRDE